MWAEANSRLQLRIVPLYVFAKQRPVLIDPIKSGRLDLNLSSTSPHIQFDSVICHIIEYFISFSVT